MCDSDEGPKEAVERQSGASVSPTEMTDTLPFASARAVSTKPAQSLALSPGKKSSSCDYLSPPILSDPRGRSHTFRPGSLNTVPTGPWLLRHARALLQAPGWHRRFAAPCQLLCIAAAALQVACGATRRGHLEPPQRILGGRLYW